MRAQNFKDRVVNTVIWGLIFMLLSASQAHASPDETIYTGWFRNDNITVSVQGKLAVGFMGLRSVVLKVKDGLMYGSYQGEPFYLFVESGKIYGKIDDERVTLMAENSAPPESTENQRAVAE